MGIASKEIYGAKVEFFGDIAALDKDPEDLEITALVDAPPPTKVTEDRNAWAFLPPLLTVAHLYLNAKAAPDFIYSVSGMLERASIELLAGEDRARAYTTEGEAFVIGPLLGSVNVPIPTLIQERVGRSKRVLSTDLMKLRSDDSLWARSRAPVRGGQGYFANSGLMLLIEHVARTADYEQTVVPMAAGLGAFVSLFESIEAEGEHQGETWDEASWRAVGRRVHEVFPPMVTAVVAASDSRHALEELKEPIPDGD